MFFVNLTGLCNSSRSSYKSRFHSIVPTRILKSTAGEKSVIVANSDWHCLSSYCSLPSPSSCALVTRTGVPCYSSQRCYNCRSLTTIGWSSFHIEKSDIGNSFSRTRRRVVIARLHSVWSIRKSLSGT